MSGVTVKLSDDDRRAIDLMFDRGAAATAGIGRDFSSADGMSSGGYHPHAAPINPDSLEAVERVLGLMSLLPDEEPPAGLVERTLARIEQSVDAVEAMTFRPALRIDPSLPPA